MRRKIFWTTLTLCIVLMLKAITVTAQTYHEDDKKGLRIFLRQPSAEEGKINAEQVGLQISDTVNWQNNEEWVSKITGDLKWNYDNPKRLTNIGTTYNLWGSPPYVHSPTGGWLSKKLAGNLDASKWTKLKCLFCGDNQLTKLDLNTNTELTDLVCGGNQLTTLDLNANTALKILFCGNNQLTTLDISANAKLTSLSCTLNQLTELNLSANTKLTQLLCSDNPFTELDISANMALDIISCDNSQLTELDLSANKNLVRLSCDGSSKLTTLDISANTLLRELSCSNNPQLNVDLRANTNLVNLSCRNNQLTTLDLSANTNLEYLYCENNQLTALVLGANTNLQYLSCENNQLPLSELFAISEILKKKNKTGNLGEQTLHAQTVSLGVALEFSVPQNVFNDIYTRFTVTQNGETVYDYTETNGKITFNKLGTYDVKMTNRAISGSNVQVTFEVTVTGETSISEFVQEMSGLIIYPNPTTEQLIIDNAPSTIDNAEYSIYNVMGQMLMQEKLSGNIINVVSLSNGMYYLHISGQTVKFLKE